MTTIRLLDARRGLNLKCRELFRDEKIADAIYRYLCDGIEECEDAEPKRKTGEWIFLDECANEGVYCSRCSKKVFRLDFSNTMKKWKNFKFCPNCGADMRGEQDE